MEGFQTLDQSLNTFLATFTTQTTLPHPDALYCSFGGRPATFKQRFLHALLLSKYSICTCIKESLQALTETQVNNLRYYMRYLQNEAETILEDGILALHFCLVDLCNEHKKRADIDAVASLQELEFGMLLKSVLKILNSLLFYFFVHKECQKRRKNGNVESKKSIVSNSKISEAKSEENSESLYEQIEGHFKNYSIAQLIQKYLAVEENQIIQSTQICRLCSETIKLRNLERHTKQCSKKAKLQTQLKELEEEKKKLFEEAQKFEKSFVLRAEKCTDREQEMLKVLKKLRQLHPLARSCKSVRRNNTQLNALKVEPLDEIRNFVELFQLMFDREDLLHSLLINREKIVEIKRKQTMLEISSKVQLTSGSQNSICSFKSVESAINNGISAPNDMKTKKSIFAEKKSLKNQSIKCQSNSSISNSMSKSEISIINSSQKHSRRLLQDACQKQNNPSIKFINIQQDIRNSFPTNKKIQPVHKSYKSLKILFEYDTGHQNRDILGLDEFEILKFLGKGAFGKVYLVRRKATRDLYALKHIHLESTEDNSQMQLIKNQHEIFKKIAGDHLIRAPFAFTEDSGHFFVLEFMSGGDLSQILDQQVYLEEEHAKFYLAEIILAVEHLHRCEIIHRDLKPQNIVIDHTGHIKLTDFGLSQIKIQHKIGKIKGKDSIKNKPTRQRNNRRVALVNRANIAKLIGTPDYIAPEIINQTSINNKSIDWWSLGVIAYEMLVGCRPFSANTIDEVIGNIVECSVEWPEIGSEEGMISQEAYDLMRGLLDRNFQSRLGSGGCDEIKNHKFFEGIDWENLKQSRPPIMPKVGENRLRQYAKLPEDENLRFQITKNGMKRLSKTKKNIGLQSFVRYDFLLQQTYESAQQKINKQKRRLQKMKTISSYIESSEKQSNQNEIPSRKNTHSRRKETKFVCFDSQASFQ